VAEGRYVKASFDVGQASSARISWGDGTSDAAVPAHGKVTFSHAYAAAGLKAATVTVVEGAQTWTVPHRIDVGALAMSRDTGLRDTLSGAAGHDVLSGDGFGNALAGGGGADTLRGEAGHDVLGGGAGRDRLSGGKDRTSQDAFLFDTKLTSKGVANQHKDQILDFGPKFDAIWFDDAAFTNRTIAKYLKGKMFSLDAPMKMKAGFFKVGTKATDKDDFFIYNARTKKLYWDVDGSGSKAMVEIATIKLQKGEGTTLTHKDFFFV
jgi:Ca2+-binding RTX toxin-like protein